MTFSVGFVYVLTNPSMPGTVKVGYTTNLSEDRALDLYSSGVPLPFEIAYQTVTSHPAAVERRAHELLADYRVNPRREFFAVEPTQAVAAVRQACLDAAGIEAWDSEGPITFALAMQLQSPCARGNYSSRYRTH